jgi:DeoR family transcriptional regulator, glycerol-3-phosphate regulon repressor
MKLEERQDRIVALLKSQATVEISELSRALDVSRETVRKDLYDLERAGVLTKVRGGAVLASGRHESAYDVRRGRESEAKLAIAREAAELVQPGDTVYLDYGTSTYALAQELTAMDGITVVTNALPIVNLLVGSPGITLMIPGGIVRSNENSLYGPLAERNLKALFMNIGFFGCGGVHPTAGITNHNMFETAASRTAVAQSQNVVVLADHSKFGVIAENLTADFDEIDQLITDAATSTEAIAQLRASGVAVTTATKGNTPA